MQHYPGFYHDILHEKERDKPIARIRDFVIRAFERPVEAASTPRNQAEFARLSSPAPSLNWTVQRFFLKAISPLSRGIALGWRHGFDSGESLDYVYTNRPNSLVDRIYLNSPGWRGIRQRLCESRDSPPPSHPATARRGQANPHLRSRRRRRPLPATR